MNGILDQLAEDYAAALSTYLAGGGEAALHLAYELGRKAIADEVGVLELVLIHNKALTAIFSDPIPQEPAVQAVERASAFFAESLSPFEMVLRGFREANTSLRNSLEQIQTAQLELHRQNQELVTAQHSLESERQRYHELFNLAPDPYLVTDMEGTILEANNPAADLLQVPQDLLVNQPLSVFVRDEERESFRAQLERLRQGELEMLESWPITVQTHGGRSVSGSLTVGKARDSQGRLVGLRCLLRDTTERKRLEEERAQLSIREHLARVEMAAAQRIKFLAETSTVLTGALDGEMIPTSIARLAVPHLADCCLVYLTDDSMTIRQFAVAHKDLDQAERMRKLQLHSSPRELPPAAAEVLRRGKPDITVICDSWLEGFAGGNEEFAALRGMHLNTALMVPLLTTGRFLGVIVLATVDPNRRYTSEDISLAEVFARRCALVLENASLYQQVVIERDRAEKASQAKEEFVAVLSHELRTPLMAILGWARVLNRQPQVAEGRIWGDGIHAMEHNAQTIARLVEDCLDVARIAEGKFQLQRGRVDLNQVASAAMEAIHQSADEKGLRLTTESAGSPLIISGDKTRLEQVLLNLLTNAIRYTEKEGEISISLRRMDQEGEIAVRDTGVGIDPEFMEQIFQPFGQGTRNWFASDSGLGLGLAIAREIVQMHGGRIWAESPGPGHGSTFRLRLPLTQLPGQEKSHDSMEPAVPPAGKPLRILFVEDSPDVLNLLRIELEDLGYSVLMARDGERGLEIATRELPDVIVSDIKMPRFDGYELIKHVRRIPPLAKIPAIALTGLGRNQDVEKAIHAGYNAHLCKPVDLNELVSLIEKLVSR